MWTLKINPVILLRRISSERDSLKHHVHSFILQPFFHPISSSPTKPSFRNRNKPRMLLTTLRWKYATYLLRNQYVRINSAIHNPSLSPPTHPPPHAHAHAHFLPRRNPPHTYVHTHTHTHQAPGGYVARPQLQGSLCKIWLFVQQGDGPVLELCECVYMRMYQPPLPSLNIFLAIVIIPYSVVRIPISVILDITE